MKIRSFGGIVKILFLVIFSLVGVLLIGSNLAIPKGVRFLAVQSGSMSPTLKAGDLIISLPNSPGEYSPQDIIVFKSPSGTLITHRIIEKGSAENTYVTKGDANDANDSDPVTGENILGKVKFSLPLLGRLVNFSKSGFGFVALVVNPSFYIIITEAITIRDEVKKSKKKDGDTPPEILSMILILISLSVFGHLTYAHFSLERESNNNVFAAGNSFSTIFESEDYSCSEGALTQESNFGSTSFSFEGSDVNFTILLQEASPSAEYDVSLQQEPGDCYQSNPNFPAGITTDSEGKAEENFTVTKQTGAERFWVELSKEGHLLRSAAVGAE